jgi:hypothetical protein
VRTIKVIILSILVAMMLQGCTAIIIYKYYDIKHKAEVEAEDAKINLIYKESE